MAAMPSLCGIFVYKDVTKKALDGRGASCSITLGECFVPFICDKRWSRVFVQCT